MNNKKVASANTSMDTLVCQQIKHFNSGRATEFIMVSQAYLDKDQAYEQEFLEKKGLIVVNLEYVFAQHGLSDHGMLEYLVDLWDQLMVSYQARLSYLQSLQLREVRNIYPSLEQETCKLADFKNETQSIFKLMRKKEQLFGNFFLNKYHEKPHTSELFSLRTEILKKIEDFKRHHKTSQLMNRDLPCEILWRGIPYADILKTERWEVENRMKEEIREEMETKKVNQRKVKL